MCAVRLWTKFHKRRQRPVTKAQLASQRAHAGWIAGDSAPMMVELPPEPTPVCLASAVSSSSAPVGETASGSPPAKRQLVLLSSVFAGRPPVLLFSYTVACGAEQRSMDRAVWADIDGPRLFYAHTDAVHEYNAVINTIRHGGLYRIRPDNTRWMLLWSSHPPPELLRTMKPSQKTNHFPGSWNLGRKDLLWRSLSRVQRRFGKSFQVTPAGYVLPKFAAAWDAARARQPDALWIWKPVSQSCGRGIKVFSSSSKEDLRELGRKRGIIQKYVANPLLIDGFKFDLRIYVVVLSYDPLKVYINEEGLVRLATEKYSSDVETLNKRTMHLTNYSVNKLSPAFVQNQDKKSNADEDASDAEEQPSCASKLSLRELQGYFEKFGVAYEEVMDRIKDVVVKTLIAVEPSLRAQWSQSLELEQEAGWASVQGGVSPSSCFEVYGFDVMLDSDIRPWLLEVNISPSLSSGSPLDKRIKTQLVADALTLVGFRPPSNVLRAAPGFPSPDLHLERLPSATPSREELADKAARLSDCKPLEAVAQFDEFAWELAMNSHDEDMRSGGLKRAFPAADSGRYTSFFSQETFGNVVLQKFYEAGGGDLFKTDLANSPVPSWIPRQVNFNKT